MFEQAHSVFHNGFYKDEQFSSSLRSVLGQCATGGADAGEVLATINGIADGDYKGWFNAWIALGARLTQIGEASAAAGHEESAASAFMRSSTYYDVAMDVVDLMEAPEQMVPTFKLHRAAWDRFVDMKGAIADRIGVPFEGTTLPGFLFRPGVDRARRKTLVMNNGSDGSIASLWNKGAVGALARGYNVFLFDGPGQQSMLFEHNMPFRPNWETVVTPVLDAVLARPEVDAERTVIYGVSQAGFWVSRALAFEHRFKAGILDPGVVDVSTSWLGHLPKPLMKLHEEGKQHSFDQEMSLGMKFSKKTAAMWAFRARPFLKDTYFDTVTEVLKYKLDQEVKEISTPLFICDPEDEQFWPGQSKQLADLLSGEKVLVPFTAAEGANYHCQPLGRLLTEQRMFDWLDGKLA